MGGVAYYGKKMVKVHALVFLLFFLAKSIILFIFFSTSLYFVSHHHILLASTYKFIDSMKGSHGVRFFMFNIVIIAILVGSTSRSAEKAHDELFLLPVSLPPPVYEEVDDNGKEASDGSDEDGESHGFWLSVWVPSLVHEGEDKEAAASEKEEDENDDDDRDGYHGSDGYEEDDEGGCSEDEVNGSEDEEERRNMDMRIQEFIDKVYRKWAEELHNEGLLFLPASRISPSRTTYL